MKQYIVLFLFFALLSCGTKKKQKAEENIKVNYTKNGLKKSEYSYLVKDLDTLFDGYYKEFYANGNMKVYAEFVKGLRQGKVIGYYENNNLKYTGSFNKNKKDGEFNYYYDLNKDKHEKLKIKEKWFKGNLIHNKYEYGENMNLEAYYFYNLGGEIYYYQLFDEEGNVTEEGGSKTPVVVFANGRQMHLNDTLYAILFTPMPIKCNTNLIARVKSFNDSWEEVKINSRDNQVAYQKVMDSVGEFRFEVKSSDSCDDKNHINAIDFTVDPKEAKIQLLEKDKKI